MKKIILGAFAFVALLAISSEGMARGIRVDTRDPNKKTISFKTQSKITSSAGQSSEEEQALREPQGKSRRQR